MLARAFQDMGQDENNEYKQLALYLASEHFIDHQSKDVRLLVACCIADIFRIFAPDAPFTESSQLKVSYNFFNASPVYPIKLTHIIFSKIVPGNFGINKI